MANTAFDFLTESFLFNDGYIENNFSRVSEQELSLELQKYREYIQGNYANLIKETQSNSKLNVSIESAGKLPNEQLLKQLALYMDRIVISDPVFEFTPTKSNIHAPMSQLMGLNPRDEIDRVRLAQNVKYMKWTTPLVATQFVKYMPISLIHEAPKDLPIHYSPDNFSTDLPKEIFDLFYKTAKVCNVLKKDGVMSYNEDEKLTLGTTIAIGFDREHIRNSRIYQFMTSKIRKIDEKSGKFEMMQYVPDSISRNDFELWVNQSINRAAISEFQATLNEAVLAKKLNCMYMAKSQFTSDLLSQTITKSSVDSELANLSLNLELPILSEISVKDLMSIRTESGEAFYNFRTELNSKLLNLRGVSDKDELQRELENISYEMNNLQVNEVKKEYRKIVKSFGGGYNNSYGKLSHQFFYWWINVNRGCWCISKGWYGLCEIFERSEGKQRLLLVEVKSLVKMI